MHNNGQKSLSERLRERNGSPGGPGSPAFPLSPARARLAGREDEIIEAVEQFGLRQTASMLMEEGIYTPRETLRRICGEIRATGKIAVPDVKVDFPRSASSQGREYSNNAVAENISTADVSGEVFKDAGMPMVSHAEIRPDHSNSGGASDVSGHRPMVNTGRKKLNREAGAVSDEVQQRIVAERLNLKNRDGE